MPMRILAGHAVIPEFDSGPVIDFIGVIFFKKHVGCSGYLRLFVSPKFVDHRHGH